MSSDILALLAAIAASPDDDLPRLVMADWLEEHGRSARAEFIRVEIELARTPRGDPRRAPLYARRDILYRTHQTEWFALFRDRGATWETDRGFVTGITATCAGFRDHARDWFSTQPITRLKLLDVWTGFGPDRKCHAKEMFTSEYFARLTYLDLERAGVNSAGVYWLSQNSELVRLRELVLRENTITDEGAKTLAGMPGLSSLESLDLAANRLTDAGAHHLIGSSNLTGLRELRITKNRIGPRAWRELEERFGRALMG